MGFIPEEWFQFFYPKTGLTGPYVFGFSLIATILSKEIIIVEEEFLCGVVMFSTFALIQKLYGKDIAAAIDKELDKENAETVRGFKEARQSIDAAIDGTQTSFASA